MADINIEMVRLARLSRGRNQKQVAEALDIKQPTYSKIENGQVALSAAHVERLADYLGYPPAFLAL